MPSLLPRTIALAALLACSEAPPQSPDLSPALVRLSAAWQESPSAVGALGGELRREALTNSVGRAWSQRAWLRGRPPLVAEGEVTAEGHAVQSLGSEPVQSQWVLEEGAWYLTDLELPLLGIEERVLGAWSGGDPGAMAPFLRDVQAVTELKAALEERGWDRLPEISSHVLEGRDGAQVLLCQGPKGKFELTMRPTGPVWTVEWRLPKP